MSIEKKIAELIALGVDGVRVASIPSAVAQECARRWLVDAARDAERARAREVERSATSTLLSTLSVSPEAIERAERARIAERERVRAEADYIAWAESLPAIIVEMPCVESDFVRPVEIRPREAMTRFTMPGEERRESGRVLREVRRLYDAGDRELAASTLSALATKHVTRTRDVVMEARREWRERIDATIEERAAELGIEWTAALLSTTVALPDGTRVEWGEATREQHAARLDMLSKHAATELETATRHRAAIDALDAAGVRCLNDLASVTA